MVWGLFRPNYRLRDQGGSVPQTYMVVEGEGDQPGYLSDYDQYGDPIGDPFYQFPGAVSEGYVSGSRFYLGPNDLFGTPLGPQGSNFLTVSESGGVQLQYGTSFDNINRGTSLNVEYGVAGTVNISTAEGEYTLPIQFARVNRVGTRWAEYRSPLTGETSNHRVAADKTLEQLNLQTPGWTRWLSPEEVVSLAVAGHLYKLASSTDPLEQQQFSDLLDAMGIDRAEFDTNASGSVQGWVEANRYNLTAASRISINP